MAPPRAAWTALMEEVGAHPDKRALLGHEYAAGADDLMAQRFIESIGAEAHVVITLRDYGSMLPSVWQEYNKAGNTGEFDSWLRRVLQRPRSQKMIDRVHVRHDQGALVRRWVAAAGRTNVTVVILNPADRSHVFSAFEAMLGLPPGLLSASSGAHVANRSFSVPELELFRQLNRRLRDADVPWTDYQRLVANGAAQRLLMSRKPHEDECKLALPSWALDTVVDDSTRHVREIQESGVRVVGDLRALADVPSVRESDQCSHQHTEMVPIDAAAEALTGMLALAVGRDWKLEQAPVPSPQPQERRIRDATARELAEEVVGRIGRRLGAVGRHLPFTSESTAIASKPAE